MTIKQHLGRIRNTLGRIRNTLTRRPPILGITRKIYSKNRRVARSKCCGSILNFCGSVQSATDPSQMLRIYIYIYIYYCFYYQVVSYCHSFSSFKAQESITKPKKANPILFIEKRFFDHKASIFDATNVPT